MNKVNYEPNPNAFSKTWEGCTRLPGLTLLDYFAGQALSGIIAHGCSDDRTYFGVAKTAYAMAESMLEVREEVMKTST